LTVERSEVLREKLLDFMERVNLRVTAAMHDFVLDAPARNTSAHNPYVDCYSDELRQLVGTRDRLIIDRHDYKFGD
jgi:hypothetical protein